MPMVGFAGACEGLLFCFGNIFIVWLLVVVMKKEFVGAVVGK